MLAVLFSAPANMSADSIVWLEDVMVEFEFKFTRLELCVSYTRYEEEEELGRASNQFADMSKKQ